MARLPPPRHIATYGFLVSERETIPPQDLVPPGCSKNLPFPPVTDPAAPPLHADRAPHSKFDRHHAPTPDHRPRPTPVAMPLLSKSNASTFAAEKFVTQ